MKRYLQIQIFLFLIGTAWMIYFFSAKQPFFIALPIKLFETYFKLPFQAGEAYYYNNQFVFYDVRYPYSKDTIFKSRCIKISIYPWKNFLTNWQLNIQDGQILKNNSIFLSRINGIIRKCYVAYDGLLTAWHASTQTIRFGCHHFPVENFLKNFNFLDFERKGNNRNIFIQNPQFHISGGDSGIHLYGRIEHAKILDASADNMIGTVHIQGKEACFKTQCQRFYYHDFGLKNLLLNFVCPFDKIVENFSAKNIQIQGQTEILKQTVAFFGNISAIDKQAKGTVRGYFAMDTAYGFGCGKFDLLANKWTMQNGVAFLNPKFCHQQLLPLIPKNPYQITFSKPLYVMGQGNHKQFSAKIFTHLFQVDGHCFPIIQADISRSDEVFSWNIKTNIKSNSMHVKGCYIPLTQQGYLYCMGNVALEWTDILKPWLQKEWHEFFQSFQFSQKYPYIDLAFKWDDLKNQAQLFGYAEAEAFHYKKTYLQHLAAGFYQQSDTYSINIHDVMTSDGRGECSVYCQCDKNNEIKRWEFSGNGTFFVKTWQSMLEDFIGVPYLQHLTLLKAESYANADFKGEISVPNAINDFLKINVNLPETEIKTCPIQDLRFTYAWDGEKSRLNHINGLLFGITPIQGEFGFNEKKFDIQIEGKQIPVSMLLQQPLFADWRQEIPGNNLNKYNGDLDIKLEAQGQWQPKLTLQGTGYLDFKNPNLSEIHLLGPLQRIFFLKMLPAFRLDQLTSEFSFTESKIFSRKTELLGPAARVYAIGAIDLEKRWISGSLQFSFFDSKQIRMPIIQHMAQIFKPFSKGFLAAVNGPFKDPHYFITFNPFHFIFPE